MPAAISTRMPASFRFVRLGTMRIELEINFLPAQDGAGRQELARPV
jgi:hypothetical protein